MLENKKQSYLKLGKLKSGLNQKLSQSYQKDIEVQSEVEKLNRLNTSVDKAVQNMVKANMLYKSAKRQGEKMDEVEEWAKKYDTITPDYEMIEGERVEGYRIPGSDKLFSWEDLYARKEQEEQDALAALEVGSEPGSIASLRTETMKKPKE